MKSLKRKWLNRVVMSTVMATCLSFAGGVSAEEPAPDFTNALAINQGGFADYVGAGVYNEDTDVFAFTQDKTTITTQNQTFAGGPWTGSIGTSVYAGNADGKPQTVTIDMNGNALEINTTNTSGSGTGIMSVGIGTTVEINNPGAMSINATSTGQTAALFANGGGQLFIHNGGEDQENKVLTLTANASNSGSGAVVKTMNGIGNGRSWIKVDGLVDIHGDVTASKGAGEGLSAVASTIEIGGGKIIMTTDGSDPNLNFGGSTPVAIRAYGEFVSSNYGIVNVNVVKEAETADAKAIGAGDNDVQIVGNFSTVGGMGTQGTINVGLNTKDSYWYGNYAFGSGFGVTPGDYGCLNLFMGNGAKWQGWTKYGTNLKMDSGAEWTGYNQGSKNLVMELNNDAIWHHTSNETEDIVTSHVQSLKGNGGYIDMTAADAGDITVSTFAGSTNVLYSHNASDPTIINGGNFTVESATEGSSIYLITDTTGIDLADKVEIYNVLDSLASKLFYTGYVDGERNLNGYVQIAEGLTSASIAAYTADIKYNAETGNGNVVAGTLSNPETQTTGEFATVLTKENSSLAHYIGTGVYDTYNDVHNFTQDTSISVADTRHNGGPWVGAGVGAAIYSNSTPANGEEIITIDMNGNALNLYSDNTSKNTPVGNNTCISAVGSNDNNGKNILSLVEINNAGPITLETKGSGMTAGMWVNGGGKIFVHNGGEDQEDKVLSIRTWAQSAGSGVGIKSMNGLPNACSWIKVDGLVDIQLDVTEGHGAGEGLSAVASTIEVGGGKIIMTSDGSDPNLNFGGDTPVAIRAYGEFVSNNYGIVNVNVEKEADTETAKAIGAGDNDVQIVGNFSTVGGMGTKGTINVGLNTKDSYWYGNYAFGSGFGVTPGDNGCLNLFMGNGAKWQGWTKYGTNLKMDSGAEWVGYNQGDKNLVMDINNGATWKHTSNETEESVTSHVQSMTADGGIIDNSFKDSGDINIESFTGNADFKLGAGNVTINKYNGEAAFAMGTGDVAVSEYAGTASVFYSHNASNPASINGGNFTVNNAAEGSSIYLITDNSGIDMQNAYVVNGVLDSLANKLFYNGYVDGERNLDGYVQIAEGLTSASATKYTGSIEYSAENGQGGLLADSLRPEIVYPESQTVTEFTTAFGSDPEKATEYLVAGVYDGDTNTLNFTADKTTITTQNETFAGGPWTGNIGTSVYAGYADGQPQHLTIDMNGNELEINTTNTSGSGTGIMSVGIGTTVEINNPGAMEINATSTGQTAALFANGGGQIFIHNGGEDQENKVLTLTANASTSGSGAVIKTMNGVGNGRSWIKVDGLVDVHGDVTSSKGAGEGLSAVASTIEVGGGKIIMTTDGSDPNLNFGGNTPVAIRAYGEFVSSNYGIVNVNVEKEADTADAKAIGAGNNDVQIVGNFSTVGGMGTRGTINVGLNTKDSYWYGNYAFGSGFGVTPGDYGCLNLFMGNGAKWQGWTKYGTNLKMDSGAEWIGYNQGSKNLVMEMNNGAIWHHTSNNTEDIVTSHVQSFKGNGGYIDMTAADAGDITVSNFDGNVSVFYNMRGDAMTFDLADEGEAVTATTDVLGGNFTVEKAAEGSTVNVIVVNNGIDTSDQDTVITVLENAADKLFYKDAEENAANLKGTVGISEGLLSASVMQVIGDVSYDTEKGGQGDLVISTVDQVEPGRDEAPNKYIYGDSETGMMRGAKSAMSSTAMIWRAENNDILKRMGDLRLDQGEAGLWAKYYGGKMNMDAQKAEFNTNYNAYQVGYDHKVGDDWTVGVALSHNVGSSTYSFRGDGDQRVTSLALYGSMVKEDGQYLDLILKGSKLDNEYTVKNNYGKTLDGDYDTWGASISAEYGKRFESANGFYFDPSIEFTVGRVASQDYNASSDYLDGYGRNKLMNVDQDAFTSAIGRLGLAVGKKLDKGSYYAKLAVAHEFAGDFDTTYKAAGEPEAKTNIDFSDTWYELRVGMTEQMNDSSYFYANLGKTFGGEVTEKWRVDAGMRFSF
ncbi:autotransporter outer membrane beta-barrel domain-containing protein [Phascolarctobacterium sp.]|uniref:autotransporter outer membrane beta-barrel domain-containing protein n=1 Tax=Phascolarctobacterium sp. TaxID=2049039 RepID=UPI00386C63E3